MQTAADELLLGRFRLIRRLGSGGFGTVWLAHDGHLDREVAVKRIPVGDADVAERARREAVAAARLQHPAIVALYETAADDDAVYLVSELVHGRTLDRRCADGELSDRDVLRIGIQLCDALAHAHQRGVIHRDVKPANVLVVTSAEDPNLRGSKGETGVSAKLTDFGIARMSGDDALTRTGDVVGTLAYMAPEQAEGRDVGPAADLYALALCVYEALAGVNPVRARGATATARRIGQRLPSLGRLRRDLPLHLTDAIDRAVWPHADERGTVKQLKAALKAAYDDVGDEPGTIEGSPLEPLAPVHARPPARLPARAAAAALAATLTAATLLGLGPEAGVALWQPVAAAAAAVALLPRAGWAAVLGALCVWAAGDEPGSAAVLAALGVPCIALWCAVQPRRHAWLRRAVLGASAAWLFVLGVPLGEGGAWEADAERALRDVVEPVLTSWQAGWVAAGALVGMLLRPSRRDG